MNIICSFIGKNLSCAKVEQKPKLYLNDRI